MRRALLAAFSALLATGTFGCSSAPLGLKVGDGATEVGASDGAIEVRGTKTDADASTDADAGTDADASTDRAEGPLAPHDPPGFEPWWWPECETADGTCPPETCMPNHVVVIKDRCGPYEELYVGCVFKGFAVATWACQVRKSDGAMIYSIYPRMGGDFGPCTDVLNTPPL